MCLHGISSTLKIKAPGALEKMADFYHTTCYHTPGDNNLHSQCCKNFKSCKWVVVVDAVHFSFHLYTLRKQVNFIVNVSSVKNFVSHGSTQLTYRDSCVTAGVRNV